MIKIEYPPYQPKIIKKGDRELIFDTIRKQWVVLTPEEWVRQNFLQYLLQVKKYPASLIAVEREILLGDIKKRFDIVVYNKNSVPWMIVECKEMNVALNESVLNQALRYNQVLNVLFLILTNGSYCLGYVTTNGVLTELYQFPDL